MRVGIVYDPIYLEHDTGHHVESVSRLVEVMTLLEKSGLTKQLLLLSPRDASVEDLLLVHSMDHISRVESMSRAGGGWLDADTVMSPASYKVALYAAGGALKGVEAVLNGEVDSAFALVRPPGHHATRWRAMGFCLFNNIAIAARYALNHHNLNRILIVDFDVHHGNGTQDIFYDDPHVLYLSTHEYPFYPGTGGVEETGEGEGKGTTVNIPLSAGCGDEEYLRVFQEILVPVARRFQPQLIMVSAGYDPHWADQIALMEVTVIGFARMAEILQHLAQELCQGRLLFALEGGYNTKALAWAVKATLEVLLGKSPEPDPLGKAPRSKGTPNIDRLLRTVKSLHGLA